MLAGYLQKFGGDDHDNDALNNPREECCSLKKL
jgi:hypothetical protein